MKGDKYIIDRDERGINGKLVRVSTFDDFKTARAAWDNTPKDPRPEVVMFFARLNSGAEDNLVTLECR